MGVEHPRESMSARVVFLVARENVVRPTYLALVSLLATATASAQHMSPQAVLPPISASVRRAVVDSIASELIRLYVDADTGRMIATRLRERLRAGTYDADSDQRTFADALTADLQSVNGDKHSSVQYAPGAPFDKPGRGGIVDDTGSSAPPRASPQDDAARRDHWDLGRVDVLAGDVGYMKIQGFEGSQQAFSAMSAALAYLEGTDAMIFDFRGMRGGSGEQSNFLISHFTGEDTVPTLVVSNRSSGSRRTRYTLAKVPGARRPNVPVWILTDRGTASAGEDFAFVMKNLGRARTVGERTAGAGHNNDLVDVGNGFGVSISYTRVADPKSGKEWERIGVLPDIPVKPRDALAVAHAAALDSLTTLAPSTGMKAALRAKRDAVLAQLRPHVPSPDALASYTGAYEGGRIISIEDGVFSYRRNAAAAPRHFVAINDSVFVFENAFSSDVDVVFSHGRNGAIHVSVNSAVFPPLTLARVGDLPPATASVKARSQ